MKFVFLGTAAAILALTFTAYTVEPHTTEVMMAHAGAFIQ